MDLEPAKRHLELVNSYTDLRDTFRSTIFNLPSFIIIWEKSHSKKGYWYKKYLQKTTSKFSCNSLRSNKDVVLVIKILKEITLVMIGNGRRSGAFKYLTKPRSNKTKLQNIWFEVSYKKKFDLIKYANI